MSTSPSSSESSATGPAWAAILAAAIGCATLGLLVDLAEACPSISKKLNLYNPSGDLSGKTSVAIMVWLIVWGLLHARWKNRDIKSPLKILAAALILILLALVAVFPPFFSLFEYRK